MSKTTLDLSTLSDITDGTHTVKVKAKADGYRDSEFSNEVSYTKAPAGYSGTVSVTTDNSYDIYYWNNNDWTLKELEVGGTHTLSGAIKYRITTVATISKFQVTSHTKCTYVLENRGWNITPSDNNFTFVFKYVGSPEPV